MKLIGITGADKSGKTLTAQLLLAGATKLGIKAVHYEMSNLVLKEFAAQLGKSVEHIKEHKDDYREALIWWANTYKKKLGNDEAYYARDMRLFIDRYSLRDCLVVASGLRFAVDATVIKDYNGVILEVIRQHTEEPKEIRPDLILMNTSTIKSLEDRVNKLLKLMYDN